MLDGWRAAEFDLSTATAIRPSGREVEGVRTVRSPVEAGPPPSLAILAFKPQQLGAVAPALAPRLSAKTVVVSVLAGVDTGTLRDHFPGAAAIVRAMPNLPVSIRRGVVALYSDDADEAQRQEVGQLFAALGFAAWTANQAGFSAIGAVAGAGPAYVARFISALANAGVQRGLDEQLARTVALETVLGTAWLAAAGGEAMEALVRRVASPNGTTEAGLAVLDRDGVLDGLVQVTIAAAARRGEELAAQAREVHAR
jgi:pyrroline-5-carboxylate reductase